MKKHLSCTVLEAAEQRVRYSFDHFSRVYVSFSGGKDSSVLFHLAASEAMRRRRKLGVLIIDLEAQYQLTIERAEEMCDLYADCIDLYW
ncbi:MAG: phosphoadenosine phosphosulfate reductase family protein, partial [Burkholderiaceae bacterium]